jgi:hypothetical protein
MIDDGEMTRIILGLAIVGVVGIATVGVLAAYRMLREIEVALRDATILGDEQARRRGAAPSP